MMADRVMRGSRLGAVSYETERNHDLAPRQIVRYRTENGGEFEVPFADDAEIPGTWLCRNGMEGTLIEGGDTAEPKKGKVPRTPWDMLRERRSIEELDELLKERLEIIKSGRYGNPKKIISRTNNSSTSRYTQEKRQKAANSGERKLTRTAAASVRLVIIP